MCSSVRIFGPDLHYSCLIATFYLTLESTFNSPLLFNGSKDFFPELPSIAPIWY
uniref:Uncharacterized protein n=1 Tax=Anguilla anguilla TaxID=7936 RepID=A0A0E9TL00_ANGAN